ncbi:MAG: ATP-binding cassette domain-containing protein [Sphingobacteriales bacterium]|nr:MAG: ATP-binding cassette domain-containing protein [Sphingobacteriales bacterium]
MKISLEDGGKRYKKQWVFRKLNLRLETPEWVAILGHNGSGKSTLLRSLAGLQSLSEGNLTWQLSETGAPLAPELVYQYTSVCAPGIELVEELTLEEVLQFHFKFKKLLPQISLSQIPELLGLNAARHKMLADFSSGMKQRVKLALALFADTPVVLLDEPCTNLDDAGIAQYLNWIQAYGTGRLLIVGSNDPREYSFCERTIELSVP